MAAVATVTPTAHAETDRRPAIDLMRFLSAFGIVWAHMLAPGAQFGYVALALFVILSAHLAVRSSRRRGPGYWRGRVRRILGLWLVWSALYLALDALRLHDATRLVHAKDPASLLIGPAIHLWFLPFLCLATGLAAVMARLLDSPARLRLAAVAAVPLLWLALLVHDRGLVGEPFVQWAFAATPLAYGLLSAAAAPLGMPALPLAMVAAATLPMALLRGSFVAPFLMSAALLFEAFWRARLAVPLWRLLGSLSLGIYLLHPFFMLVWYHFAGPGVPVALGACAVFLASALATAALRSTPLIALVG
jgi:peptidoglycan/LPS O-acetylase OafA/YrhL